jgi:hypothetical protein
MLEARSFAALAALTSFVAFSGGCAIAVPDRSVSTTSTTSAQVGAVDGGAASRAPAAHVEPLLPAAPPPR